MAKATTDRVIATVVAIWPTCCRSASPKIRPAKMMPFFVHWAGRSDRSSSNATGRPPARLPGLAEDAGLRTMSGGQGAPMPGSTLRETLERFGFDVERLEDREELRDRKQ